MNETRGQLHHSSVLVGGRIVHSPLLAGNDYLEFESHPRVTDAELIGTLFISRSHAFLLFNALVISQ